MSESDQCILTKDVYLDKDGYPRVKHDKRLWRLNRLIYTYTYGEIPIGMVVAHKCNNPGCINPRHFYATTPEKNSTDAARDKLYFTGHHNPHLKKAEEDLDLIWHLYNSYHWTQEMIGRRYKIHQTRVSELLKGYTYDR